MELSAQYFDIIKDRLYTWKRDGKARRSALTVLHAMAEDLIRLLGPVLSFTASEAWSHLPGRPAESVFLAGMPRRAAAGRRRGAGGALRQALRGPRGGAGEAGGGAPGQAHRLRARGGRHGAGRGRDARRSCARPRQELPTLFIVSGVQLAEGPLAVEVTRAPGQKCERCWIYREDVGADPKHPTICGKCADALA